MSFWKTAEKIYEIGGVSTVVVGLAWANVVNYQNLSDKVENFSPLEYAMYTVNQLPLVLGIGNGDTINAHKLGTYEILHKKGNASCQTYAVSDAGQAFISALQDQSDYTQRSSASVTIDNFNCVFKNKPT